MIVEWRKELLRPQTDPLQAEQISDPVAPNIFDQIVYEYVKNGSKMHVIEIVRINIKKSVLLAYK